MRIIAVIAALVLFCSVAKAIQPLADEEYQFLFSAFMKEYDRQYEHEDFHQKFSVFKSNLDYIRAHNIEHAAGKKSYYLAINKFGDMTNEEFKQLYTGANPRRNSFIRSQNTVTLPVDSIPDSVDWVSQGKVTPVKNQEQCGSCWAFSTTGAVESANAIANGKLVSLSEQQLVDCSGSYGNQGCNGGLMDDAFEYVRDHGLCSESSYPYKAVDGSCKSCTAVVQISGYTDVTPNDANQLKAAVAQQPVSVAVEADGLDWQFYSGGVVSDNCGANLDHGVLVVGYGTDGGKGYFKVKNSWGSDWGESGYIRISSDGSFNGGAGECGILSVPSYPTA